jgi:GNAT superfamily N-acetyltransferase
MTSQQRNHRISIVPSSPRYAEQMQDLMHAVYNSTRDNPDGTFLAEQFRRHMQIFPEGQFVALEAGRVVGLTASMRIAFDPAHPFIENWYVTISDGWLTRHDPGAEWMYGVESCVHPQYQSFGIGGRLMQARFDTAQALNLRGMVAGSAIISYHKVADQVSAEDYLQGVIAGTYFDNNLSKQIRKGFRPVTLIPDYLPDPETRGWGVVIVWDNPTFDSAQPIGALPIRTRRYRFTPKARKTTT